MSATAITRSSAAARAQRPALLETRRARLAGLLAASALLALCALASLAFGSLAVPFAEVIRAFTAYDGSDVHAIVRDLRVPRTELGILVGVVPSALRARSCRGSPATRSPTRESSA